MKIFLTGQPHSGKTTMLNGLIDDVAHKQGFVTTEIPDPSQPGGRLGFELIDASGRKATLAHISSTSKRRVSRYGVEINTFENFMGPLSNFTPTQLLYIDEVGAMELFSDSFRQLVESYLQSPNHFIGTISNTLKDPLITSIIKDPNITIYEISPDNRDVLFTQLQADINRLQL